MRALDTQSGQIAVVTGSSGFIGTHLCEALRQHSWSGEAVVGIDRVRPTSPPFYRYEAADIRCAEAMRSIREKIARPGTLIHLAATAEVVLPWQDALEMLSNNIEGSYWVADALNPRTVIFASTCSVYGHATLNQTDPDDRTTQPLSLYGISKAAGEMIFRDWARSSGNAAVILRLGNVIGSGCRGLIAYLGEHMWRHPRGDVVARLRGGGMLVRDYVPVGYVVQIMLAAMETEWEPGTTTILNVGTGRGTTNGEVAAIARRIAQRHGLRLEISFADPPAPGEAGEIVLQVDRSIRRLGILPPGPEEVVASIEDSFRAHLQDVCECL